MNQERSRPVQPLPDPLHLVPRVFALGTLVLAAAGLLRAPSSVQTTGEAFKTGSHAQPLQALHALGGELRFEENAGQTDPARALPRPRPGLHAVPHRGRGGAQGSGQAGQDEGLAPEVSGATRGLNGSARDLAPAARWRQSEPRGRSEADFPTENPIQPELGDRLFGALGDAFVAKLNVGGDALVYSTYLGGVGTESGEDIAVDAEGNAYVTGGASSMDFPTTSGAFQSAPPGGENAFVAKLDPSGSSLVYSTFLGGSGSDYGDGIAVDADGNAYVTGGTGSADFPTENAFQAAFSGGGGHPYLASDAFVSKLDPTGSELIYWTYLGGPAEASRGVAVALDSEGNAYVTGATAAFDFPVTAEALQPELGGASDAFVTKFSPAGNEVIYSTFLGGTKDDAATAIAVDALGQAHVAGTSRSLDFPIANAFQDSNAGARDAADRPQPRDTIRLG